MTTVTVRLDADLIEEAARSLGIWSTTSTPASITGQVLREVAGRRRRSAIADGGAAPKRAGRSWENSIVTYANSAGMAWDRAPLRGARDLLDVTGCLPAGWLIGGKSKANGVSAGVKMSEAMEQCHRALGVLADRGEDADVIPWQIIQRPGAPVGRAYAVTEYDWMLQLCKLRAAGEWGRK